MLRTAAGLPAPMWILNAAGRYRLDPALIGTDLQAFGAGPGGSPQRQRRRPAGRLPPGGRAVPRRAGRGRPDTNGPSRTPRPPAAARWTPGPPSPRSSSPPTPTRPCPPWRRPWPTTPTTSTCTCGSCGCRPQRAAPRPSAGRWPCWNRNSPTSASRPAPRPGRPPPPCSPPPDPHPASNPVRRAARAAHRVTPPGNVRRPHPARPAARSHATVTTPGPIPPRTGQRDRPAGGASRHSEFRQPCALNGRRAPPGRCASRSPAAATSGTDDPAHRTPDADPPASSARFRRPCRRRDQAAGRITRPARRRARRRRPRAGAGTRREKAGPGGHSAPPAIPYSFPYTCRHRNPPDPGNAQAVPGINLRVNSQTYIRAQLVKQ